MQQKSDQTSIADVNDFESERCPSLQSELVLHFGYSSNIGLKGELYILINLMGNFKNHF